MTNRTQSGRLTCICACALAVLAATACGSKKQNEPNVKGDRDAPGVWFVHATDPHIFVPDAYKSTDKDAKAAGEKQQELNEKALKDMLSRSRSLPDGDGPPAFLVLTGDLGVDPCPITTVTATPALATRATAPPQAGQKDSEEPPVKSCVTNFNKDERQNQIQKLAALLGSSPLKDIYVVAGNNDIAREDPGDDALAYFNELLDKVQTKIAENKSNVQLHNLSRCYLATGGNSSSCFADVAGTSYRMIGFPSYSFKNQTPNADLKAQEKQFAIFRGLLDQSRQAGKKALVLSHVPEIDDPFTLAQNRYLGKPLEKSNDPDANNARSRWSTWNVSKKLLDDWYAAVASDSVEAVLAGHLHDSHQEIYRPPYSWSTLTSQRGGFQKLFLAPPLAVKKQDNSPIQARGFSLIHLESDRVRPQLYWYNSETGDFKAELRRDFEERERRGWWHWPRFIGWAWGLDQSDSSLARLAVLMIALLTAFLTVVAIWQIPAAKDMLADSSVKTGKDKKDEQPAADASPFASRFGKTVIAGLGGLVMTEVTKTLGDGKPSADTRWFYIVWFILLFFTLLVLLNLVRAIAEAVRARVVVVHYPWPPVQSEGHRKRKRREKVSYWISRFVRWWVSLRVPALTFIDSFINLIQGKNQTMTQALADTVINQQRSIVRVADAIRQDLNDLIDEKVADAHYHPKRHKDENKVNKDNEENKDNERKKDSRPHHVRVNISVLSTDQTNVFYISRAVGSSRMTFPKHSLAWVSVFTGSIRWYFDRFLSRKNPKNPQEQMQPTEPEKPKGPMEEIVLFDNTDKTIPDAESELLLKTYYQPRPGQDYEAFVLLPLPWPPRGYGSDYVKGAIHISFHCETEFQYIWKDGSIYALETIPNGPHPVDGQHTKPERCQYPANASKMLDDWCCDHEVRAALHVAMKALSELLHGFNEEIYRSYIEPTQPH